jgi:YbbR domain-containing protein
MKAFRNFIRTLPTILTALVFAIAIWVLAVTESDPTETRTYPKSVEMDVIGLDPDLMIVNEFTEVVTLTIRAPSSILDELENDSSLISVTLDLSGLDAGVHTLTPQANLNLIPAEVTRVNPSSIYVKLDSVISEEFPVNISTIGSPAIGFELQPEELSDEQVTVSGPKSLIDSIDEVLAEIDVEDISEDLQRTVQLIAYDSEGIKIDGITITPDSVQVLIPVSQRGDYDTVVVKIVTSGQIAAGYRLTNIFALPATVTIFAEDPALLEDIPGYVETTPINLDGANEDMEIRVTLNLSEGISVVGDQSVTVQIGIDPIEGSVSFADIPVQIEGLSEGLEAVVSPETVDVYLSGPLNLLEELDPGSIYVRIDLSERDVGTYQLAPEVLLDFEEINVDAILPNTLEVTIAKTGQLP